MLERKGNIISPFEMIERARDPQLIEEVRKFYVRKNGQKVISVITEHKLLNDFYFSPKIIL